MQIPYKYYDFNWPPTITELDYKGLKRTVESEPNFKFVKEPSFYEKFKWGILLAIISTVITIILVYVSKLPWDISVGIKFRIIGIASVVDFFMLVGLFGLAGGASYLWYEFERNLYYRRMKRALIQSANFNAFLAGFYRHYYRNRYPFA